MMSQLFQESVVSSDVFIIRCLFLSKKAYYDYYKVQKARAMTR